MASSIPLTGLAANDPVPGNYIQVNFAQGAASLGQNTYAILLLGNKLSTGSATADTVIYGPSSATPLVTTADAISLFGQGSELHRMWKRVLAVNTSTPVYALAVTESGGTAASKAITFATTATANGSIRTYVGDEFVDTAVASGDTAIVAATAVCASVNAKLDWPVTADNGSGTLAVVTLTAKQKGPRGNWIRVNAVMSSTAMSMTSNTTAPSFLTSGATADSNTTALSTILPYRYYYIVSAAEDSTQLGALVAQVDSQALPISGIRQRVFGASIDTSSNAKSVSTSSNIKISARCEITWMQNADWTPAELAANAAAVYAAEEAPLQFRCNFSGYGLDAVSKPLWKVPAPRSGTAPTRATIKDALNNGLTALGVTADGSTYISKRITTYIVTTTTPDYRIRDAHKVTICDRYADDLYTKFVQNFSGKLIADDPAQGQRVPGSNVVTPRVLKAAINKLTADYADLDLLQRSSEIQANTLVIRETSPTTRMSARIPLQPIDILDQTATAIDQVA